MDNKYTMTFDEFLAEHPEIDPEWRSFIEPVIQSNEDSFYSFIMSYIFM